MDTRYCKGVIVIITKSNNWWHNEKQNLQMNRLWLFTIVYSTLVHKRFMTKGYEKQRTG